MWHPLAGWGGGGGKVDLDLWPKTNRVIPSSSTCEVWKRLDINCSIVPTRPYTQCQSWPWPLTLCPKSNRVSPIIIHNLHVKFESDWTKTVVCIVSTRSNTQDCKSWPWPLTLWPKIKRVPQLIIHNLHVKFESNWTKTVVCILSTRSYTQSAKVDLDLWPCDPKSIGFLFSSSETYK